jgi:hypothetical protein
MTKMDKLYNFMHREEKRPKPHPEGSRKKRRDIKFAAKRAAIKPKTPVMPEVS